MRALYVIGFVVIIGWISYGTVNAQESLQPFVDVAPVVGVDDQGTGRGIAWGDYDHDGWVDLAVTNSMTFGYLQPSRLFQHTRGEAFIEVARKSGMQVGVGAMGGIWGDCDNDGDIDLFLMVREKVNRLYRGTGMGRFEEVGAIAGVANPGPTLGAAWGDYDRDGWLDLYVTNEVKEEPNRLYHNQGNGTFQEVGRVAGVADSGYSRGCAWGDYDNDGWLDLYVMKDGQPNRLYHNQRGGAFQDIGATAGVTRGGAQSRGGAWGDYDNDGWLDLYVVKFGRGALYHNNQDGTFTDVARQARMDDQREGWSAAWGDYDNDGWLDLYITSSDYYRIQNQLYRNQGDGSFTAVGAELGVMINAVTGRGVAWGDYDRDGFLDLYVVKDGLPNSLYRNPGNSNHWLIIQPVGVRSNSSAIGAKVRLFVEGRQQLREISGGSGIYGSQSQMVAAFGLGSATVVDSVVVEWPSGGWEVWRALSVDQAVILTEGVAPAVQAWYGRTAGQIDSLVVAPLLIPQGIAVPVRVTAHIAGPENVLPDGQATMDLTAIGGGAELALRDDGMRADAIARDGIYSAWAHLPATLVAGEYPLGVRWQEPGGGRQERWTRVGVAPRSQLVYAGGLAPGWQVEQVGAAESDPGARHRIRLLAPKAQVVYRWNDPAGFPLWGYDALVIVLGGVKETVPAVTVNGQALAALPQAPLPQGRWRVTIPVARLVEQNRIWGSAAWLPGVVVEGVGGRTVEVWVDTVRFVAPEAPMPIITAVEENEQAAPLESTLLPSIPNPFNAETVLRYQVSGARAPRVVLRVYDLSAQVVRTLVEAEQAPGGHSVRWDGRDKQGLVVASGVYFSRLEVGTITQTQKLLLLR